MNWQDDGPAHDPLDVAATNAAARLCAGLPMTATDWDALKQRACNELQEFDFTASF